DGRPAPRPGGIRRAIRGSRRRTPAHPPIALAPRPVSRVDGGTADEFESVLRRHVLDVWFPRSLDSEHGGFLCDFDRAWRPCGPHDKLLEFQARQTWLAAEASLRYPAHARLRRAVAARVRYLREAMGDGAEGGWFHRLDRAGRPLEAHTKHVHGTGYAIAACVAVHEAGGDPGALDLARQAFDWLEQCAHDDGHGGYFGFLTRGGSVIRDDADGRWPGATDTIGTPIGLKDTNVHSDLLECFTRLYRVWPHPRLAERLAEIVALVTERITVASGALHYFFQPDWTPLPHLARFGYQLQTAWRLLHARGLAPDPSKLATRARRMMDHALGHGWDDDVGGFFEAAPGSAPAQLGAHDLVVRRKPWWVQTEALTALLSLDDLDGGHPGY